MSGLRDRKKQEARDRIVRAAVRLFADRGIDGTTMEDVAGVADVSVATVYNYFGTKTALVVAGVSDDADRILEDGAAVLARPGRDARRAAHKLIGIYLDHFVSWDRHLLTEVISAMFRRGAGEMTAQLVQIDERSIVQLAQLLEHFQSKGQIDGDMSPNEGAILLYSIVLTHIVIWLSLDDYPVSELSTQINRQIDLAFSGITARKDNP